MNEKLFNIVEKIQQNNGECYLVGGCVRDQLLGKTPSDYDVVTNLRPSKLEKIFDGGNVDLVGKTFGVVIVDGIEIATFRKDVYSADKLHGKGADSVEYAGSIQEDLSRRDFTINAMAQEIYVSDGALFLGKLIDPFKGQQALRDKVVRFVGNPKDRITEDPCRILRGFRFASTFNFTFANLASVIENRGAFKLIASERIRLEVLKTLSKSDEIVKFFKLLKVCQLLEFVFPSLDKCVGVDGGQHHKETVFDHCVFAANSVSTKYPMIRLAALLHDVGKPKTRSVEPNGTVHFHAHEAVGPKLAERDLKALKFSNDEIKYVCEMIENHMFFFNEITHDSAYRRLMSRCSMPIRDLLRLRIADRKGNLSKRHKPVITRAFKKTLQTIRRIEKENDCLQIKDLVIGGKDLIEKGYKPGPFFAKALQACLDEVIEMPSRNDRGYLLNRVDEMFIEMKGGNK